MTHETIMVPVRKPEWDAESGLVRFWDSPRRPDLYFCGDRNGSTNEGDWLDSFGPVIAAAVRECWEKNRPLAENEVRDMFGNVVTFAREGDIVTTNTGFAWARVEAFGDDDWLADWHPFRDRLRAFFLATDPKPEPTTCEQCGEKSGGRLCIGCIIDSCSPLPKPSPWHPMTERPREGTDLVIARRTDGAHWMSSVKVLNESGADEWAYIPGEEP